MISIRRATAADAALVLELITALAEHHGLANAVEADKRSLLADGFGDEARFGVLIAEDNGSTAGFLSWTTCYSIWRCAPYMQIDDVFVHDEFRGMGVGEALMNESRRICGVQGLSRIKWEVQPDNAAAIRFYERLGAKGYDKRLFSWIVE